MYHQEMSSKLHHVYWWHNLSLVSLAVIYDGERNVVMFSAETKKATESMTKRTVFLFPYL